MFDFALAGLAVRLWDRRLSGHKDEALMLALNEYAEADEWPVLTRGRDCYF